MTPHQLRRLEALTAAAAPCLGCHQEDLIEAKNGLDFLAPAHLIELQAKFERAASPELRPRRPPRAGTAIGTKSRAVRRLLNKAVVPGWLLVVRAGRSPSIAAGAACWSPGIGPRGRPALNSLLLLPSAPGVPVLLDPDGALLDTGRGQLGPLAHAAFELGKAGKASEPDHVLPQPHGLLLTG